MLYDNEDQLDVRHVISLARYEVDIYAGGERIPEGELWIKRNCRPSSYLTRLNYCAYTYRYSIEPEP
jgi:hypothetical protein